MCFSPSLRCCLEGQQEHCETCDPVRVPGRASLPVTSRQVPEETRGDARLLSFVASTGGPSILLLFLGGGGSFVGWQNGRKVCQLEPS